MSTLIPTSVVEYPSGDGQPTAETWLHVRAIMLLHQALEDFFYNRPDVFIASDIFWYWEEGNPAARIAPDVMVVPGVQPRDPRKRRSFFSWEEYDAIPSLVFEMASRSTVNEDLGDKYWKYEELGVREYFLFDPEATHLVPVLQGFRLQGSSYRRLVQADDMLGSELGFRLRAEGTMLRLINARTGQPIPTRAEAVTAERDRADMAQLNAAAERDRADVLQAEVDRLKNLLRKHGEPDGGGT
jgi:Uma2 family endonuclease